MRAEIYGVVLADVTLAAFIEVIDAFEMRVDVTRGEAAADGAVETHGHEVFGEAVSVLAHGRHEAAHDVGRCAAGEPDDVIGHVGVFRDVLRRPEPIRVWEEHRLAAAVLREPLGGAYVDQAIEAAEKDDVGLRGHASPR